jgi:hypothetical protein
MRGDCYLELPRILIPRTSVNKPRWGSSEVTVVVVEAAPKHPILPDSSRVPNRLYLHSQRGLPVGSCMSLRLMLGHTRDNLRKDTGRLRITRLHKNARYPDYEHDRGQHHDEAFGLAHATRMNHSFEGCAGCLWLLPCSGLGKGRIGLLGQSPSPEKALWYLLPHAGLF